jgi:hypothetical protein
MNQTISTRKKPILTVNTVKITILRRDRHRPVPTFSNAVYLAYAAGRFLKRPASLSVSKRSMTVLNRSIAFSSILTDSYGHETVMKQSK